MLVAISYLMLTGAFYLILDTINEEPHQIKTNQDQKKWLAVLSLAQLSPSLFYFYFTNYYNHFLYDCGTVAKSPRSWQFASKIVLVPKSVGRAPEQGVSKLFTLGLSPAI